MADDLWVEEEGSFVALCRPINLSNWAKLDYYRVHIEQFGIRHHTGHSTLEKREVNASVFRVPIMYWPAKVFLPNLRKLVYTNYSLEIFPIFEPLLRPNLINVVMERSSMETGLHQSSKAAVDIFVQLSALSRHSLRI
ncbi:hypothetical protein BDZ94DRAFT_413027 [Collybia nuda]|uniref:Uncharacterized protein n=1 Tax=Collybia nuda TaxID=64659 RepID=A0A9P5YAB0_9AGAR|nr:hypothetical protein BDZ94DRAFT_413027 [Collybia nuda]